MLLSKIKDLSATVCVIGVGYVGLPTAVVFAEAGFNVIGADIKKEVVRMINSGKSHLRDLNLDNKVKKIVKGKKFRATLNIVEAVKKSDIILITVPTPITKAKIPDLRAVISASHSVGKGLKKDKLVILESTVYPLTTEEIVKPILEEESNLKAGKDFFLAFSPESYNPGDKKHWITNMTKIVGGYDKKSADLAVELYKKTIKRVERVENARTAEAAKIIQNIQRDLNIALINELAIIFEKMNIDVYDVLEAAKTKWNFLTFYPGPGVGGHCLPVDPFYLVHKAKELGYHTKVITAGREINDYMPYHVIDLVVKTLNQVGKPIKHSKISILGVAYKPNIGDARNSPAKLIIERLKRMGAEITIHDPWVPKNHLKVFGVNIANSIDELLKSDCLVVVTDHKEYHQLKLEDLKNKMNDSPIIIDNRSLFKPEEAKKIGFIYKGVGRV